MAQPGSASIRPALPDDVLSALDRIGTADVVVGIPSLNNRATIGSVVTAVEVGLRKLFPDLRSVICISDGGSEDGTRDAAVSAGAGDREEELLVPPSSPVPEKLVFRYGGLPGKGSALRAVFEAAARLDARACVVMDADLRSVTPYWIDRLLTPVVHYGFELVAPMYVRHRHDGTITNAVAYPMTAALYGVRLRQPIGGEFAMSGDLAREFAAADVWGTDVARFGVDLWMTTTALVARRRVCQAILGAKLHDPKDPGQSLAPMFKQVVGTLFALTEANAEHWREIEDVTTPRTFGFSSAVVAEPVSVSVPLLRQRYAEGRDRWRSLWDRILSAETAAVAMSGDAIDADAWVAILYEYAAAWVTGEDRTPLLESLIPLYFARTAAFVERTETVSEDEVEAEVEAVVDAAVRAKSALLSRWPTVAAT